MRCPECVAELQRSDYKGVSFENFFVLAGGFGQPLEGLP